MTTRGSNTAKPVGIMKAYLDAGCPMAVFKKTVKASSRRNPQAFGIDAVLCVDPELIVVVFIKEMLLAGMCFVYFVCCRCTYQFHLLQAKHWTLPSCAW